MKHVYILSKATDDSDTGALTTTDFVVSILTVAASMVNVLLQWKDLVPTTSR